MSVSVEDRPILGPIALTHEERALADQIDFDLARIDDRESSLRSCALAYDLLQLLKARNAIPECRVRYFVDTEYNVRCRGNSRKDLFEAKGWSGAGIYTHPHFLKYLRYFVMGTQLPVRFIDVFWRKVEERAPITSGDIEPLRAVVRQEIRAHGLQRRDPAEEVFKLALDCGLYLGHAIYMREAAKSVR